MVFDLWDGWNLEIVFSRIVPRHIVPLCLIIAMYHRTTRDILALVLVVRELLGIFIYKSP